MTLTPEFALAAVVTTGAAAVMLRLGFLNGALKARSDRGRCVSCGRRIGARGCPNCSR